MRLRSRKLITVIKDSAKEMLIVGNDVYKDDQEVKPSDLSVRNSYVFLQAKDYVHHSDY